MMTEEEKKQAFTVLGLPIAVLITLIFVACYIFVTQGLPKFQEFASLHENYKAQMEAYSDKERTLEDLKARMPKASEKDANLDVSGKALFRPLESGLDTETIISSEFNEILVLMTTNSIKTRSINFTPDPADDNFVKGNSSKYTVSKLDMEMIATYSNFKSFMKELYKHDHYLDIAKVEIVPYPKNKSILLINLQLKLYAEKA